MRDFNGTEARESWVGRPASAARPSAALCPYPINSGVMVVSPLGEAAWRERIVRPMRRREVASYDGGDQGAINTLLYGPAALYGAGLEGHMRLHPRYNVLGRTAKHAAKQRVESANCPATLESCAPLVCPAALVCPGATASLC